MEDLKAVRVFYGLPQNQVEKCADYLLLMCLVGDKRKVLTSTLPLKNGKIYHIEVTI